MASSRPSPVPSSPGMPPVHLSDCIEELVRFTMSSSIDGKLGADLCLSRDYCARLLQGEGPLDDRRLTHLLIQNHASEACGGVPVYPLYKRLAQAIQGCINSGSFLKTSKSIRGFQEDESLKGKEKEWGELIADKGSELLNMYKAVEFELHVQEPFFSQLRAGLKTIEGRCALGDYNRIGPGALLLFNKCLLLRVQNVKCYPSFLEMLEVEGLMNVLPGVETIDEGVQIYRCFYTEEKEKTNGVLAISVSRPDSQPYSTMSALLSGLGYEGVSCLLGIVHTIGTTPDALPPPRSALLSSFMSTHRPDCSRLESYKCDTSDLFLNSPHVFTPQEPYIKVKGSSLSDGARALAKHVSRSSNCWWGTFSGSDSNKNQLALGVINHLITHSCWMNVHALQPYEFVFEIRVGEGYGARWSIAGSKFIGFLEPYMEEGHSKGWRH